MDRSSFEISIPLQSDDEVDNALLPTGKVWAYPCKHASCPDYGKSWLQRSEFLFHLHGQGAHKEHAATAADRRAVELEWRYITEICLPPRQAPHFGPQTDPREHIWTYGIKDKAGNIINRTGTEGQMREDLARLQRS